jgi:uncharacterized protein (TIGR03085 family)
MSRTDLAQAERSALCDLFLEVGPDHPTLCGAWTTSHLAAHLVIRERNPLAGPGIVLGGPFAAYTERALDKTRTTRAFEDLVATVRSGPPFPLRLVDGQINLVEYFVHLEDVRRAAGGWEPRAGTEALEEALWAMQGAATKLMVRGLQDVALTLRRPDGAGGHDEKAIRTKGRPASITGPATEIVLFLYGRRDEARVALDGDPEAVTELREGKLGV